MAEIEQVGARVAGCVAKVYGEIGRLNSTTGTRRVRSGLDNVKMLQR